MKFKIKYASQIVGVFVILAFLFLAVILMLMGVNQRWFAKNYLFKSRFASGTGLSVGMPISFKGFDIGKIRAITLAEDNTVEIDFTIQDTFYPKVYENSLLQLRTNPLGLGGGLFFHQGKTPTPPLEEFSQIPSLDLPEGREIARKGLVNMPKDDDPVNRLIGAIEPILTNADLALVSMEKLLATVDSALAGGSSTPLAAVVDGAARSAGNLGTITAQVARNLETTLGETNALLANLREITANLRETTAALRDPRGMVKTLLDPKGSLATLLDDNDRLFLQLEGILQGAAGGVGELKDFAAFVNTTRPQLLGVLEEGREAVRLSQDVLQGLRNNPLLRGGVPPRPPAPTIQTGYRDEALR